MRLTDTVVISPQAMARQVGEETVILDLASGNYLGLDPVGTRIWQLLGEGQSLAAVLEAILAEYEVGRDQAQSDLLKLMEQMQAHGLVSTSVR